MAKDYASNPAEIPEATLVEFFFEAVERFEDLPAFRHHAGGTWHDMTHREALAQVRAVAMALQAEGLTRGDRAAILAENRPEWALADYACLSAGIVGVPVYATLMPDQVRYILADSAVRAVFVSDAEQLAKVQQVRSELEALDLVVVFDPPPGSLPEGVVSWADLLAKGRAGGSDDSPEAFMEEALSARPSDLATILYTSGTTGDPKGVMLTHRNLTSNVLAASRVLVIDEHDTTLSFLPLSHVFQRMVDYLLFSRGCVIAYARSIETVPDDLRAIRPTIVVSVPRLYEKVYAKVTSATGAKGALVGWARGVGEKWARAKLAGREPSAGIRLQYGLANKLVFSKIAAGVGGNLRYFVSGGAPLAPDINRFFFASGVMILEGYGLSETSPVTNVNNPADFPENFRIGTVGKPVAGTEVRIAEDGEILVRGPQVMKGYLNRPEDTAEAIDGEGWFHTGDIGEIDEEDFLRITDRKKDIIVTAGGKNVAPQPIENRLKNNRFLDQPVLVGDRERFITLLLVPDFEALEGWAKQEGIPVGDRRTLLGDARVQSHLKAQVEGELSELARYEMPKKLVLLDEPFTIEDGSLTPTQKVKRRVVQERLAARLGEVYDEANARQDVFVSW
ncbi:AMP-dependent synthetase/ligase [soil metagenome]